MRPSFVSPPGPEPGTTLLRAKLSNNLNPSCLFLLVYTFLDFQLHKLTGILLQDPGRGNGWWGEDGEDGIVISG